MSNQEKRKAGEAALTLIQDGMTIGLGTGSTVSFFLQALGKKVAGGMRVQGVPTSKQTAALCNSLGIKLLDSFSVERLDITIDGADEIDSQLRMIKGGGGALLREKIVAEISERVIIIVDSTKLVPNLGAFPLPIEVASFGYRQVQHRLMTIGITANLRLDRTNGTARPYVTDNGNYVLDCDTGIITAPESLASQLKVITGVIETGLFTNHCHTLIIGKETGVLFQSRNTIQA